ncbi:MAG: hypothetical protein LBU34_09995 [Planctomycetaceae bacterium]|jgi:RNA polymerase subunit RPABC4/transcription elongation factor Spt4|nr:hypothetical protein [Planctomycetaceae bacterium]
MAISSATITRSSVVSGLSNSNYCSVCGKASSVTSNIYASYGGRVGNDSYVCETCGKTLTSQKNSGQSANSFYTASGATSSGYCPQCNSSSSQTNWAGKVAATSSALTSSTAKSNGTTYGAASWAK